MGLVGRKCTDPESLRLFCDRGRKRPRRHPYAQWQSLSASWAGIRTARLCRKARKSSGCSARRCARLEGQAGVHPAGRRFTIQGTEFIQMRLALTDQQQRMGRVAGPAGLADHHVEAERRRRRRRPCLWLRRRPWRRSGIRRRFRRAQDRNRPQRRAAQACGRRRRQCRRRGCDAKRSSRASNRGSARPGSGPRR
jgi:hypothetical protein